MLDNTVKREVTTFNYNAIIKVDIMCPETGKPTIKTYKVKYHAGGIEPDDNTLVNKILRVALNGKREMRK
jgi:hypothetical protein